TTLTPGGQSFPPTGTSQDASRATTAPPASSAAGLGPVGTVVRTIGENKVATAGFGALVLATVLGALQALLGSLTKPLGMGTMFLIPLIAPARRRREKWSQMTQPLATRLARLRPAISLRRAGHATSLRRSRSHRLRSRVTSRR
ncbi:MAG: hypothetical protein OXC71_05975, partial [Chloroflexi bacterium]|nr:hypothetical protein [Chloroflexota bacterium]